MTEAHLSMENREKLAADLKTVIADAENAVSQRLEFLPASHVNVA